MDITSPRPARVLTLSGYYGFALIGWNAVSLYAVEPRREAARRQHDQGSGMAAIAACSRRTLQP